MADKLHFSLQTLTTNVTALPLLRQAIRAIVSLRAHNRARTFQSIGAQ